MENKRGRDFTRKDYLRVALICIIFYSLGLGWFFANLNSYLLNAPPLFSLSNSTLGRWTTVGGLGVWLVLTVALAWGTSKKLESIGFGAIAISTAIFTVEKFIKNAPIIIWWIQVILYIIIITSLAIAIYNQIKKVE